ncbi:hypothetical protein DIC66_03695 [Rhodoferax lacus]|uniref:Uncharacterized protein n=1 Tax=Rhodoferax lacus TaxID=2184758 RepID=A0A3E1RFP3_9BURK|nr:hypothetical protein [Rhodoferax lacus]RFO97842.1 hypothetical protein DIC66_03695 [Rhodoferax lacus]
MRDPRGHSLRIYDDVYDSHAFAALSPHDVLAYLALLRELKGFNNGDLSLPLTRAKKCGINHHVTLARSLRALCAVGLVSITQKGGCTRGGQRKPTLYRVTDRECFEIPAKLLDATKETNEWQRITSVQQAVDLIAAAELAVKKEPEEKNSPGHDVTATVSRGVLVGSKTRTWCDTWNGGPGHGVTMAIKGSNPMAMRVATGFLQEEEKAIHRTPHVPPLYVAIPTPAYRCTGHHNRHRWLTQGQLGFLVSLTSTHQSITH